jgi:hypothetical protein
MKIFGPQSLACNLRHGRSSPSWSVSNDKGHAEDLSGQSLFHGGDLEIQAYVTKQMPRTLGRFEVRPNDQRVSTLQRYWLLAGLAGSFNNQRVFLSRYLDNFQQAFLPMQHPDYDVIKRERRETAFATWLSTPPATDARTIYGLHRCHVGYRRGHGLHFGCRTR